MIPLVPLLWLLLFAGLHAAVGVYIVLMVLLAAHSTVPRRMDLPRARGSNLVVLPSGRGATATKPSQSSATVIALERRR